MALVRIDIKRVRLDTSPSGRSRSNDLAGRSAAHTLNALTAPPYLALRIALLR